MKAKFYLTYFLVLLSGTALSQKFLAGYEKTIKGETINYHAPQPDAGRALLIRSEDNSRYIEWQTVLVPFDYKEKTVRFLMLAGIDVNAQNPHSWDLSIDGADFFKIHSPINTNSKSIFWEGKDGYKLVFNVQSIDRHGDFMGYLILEAPADDIKGKALTIRIRGESAWSQTWFMVFEYKTERKINLVAEPAIIKGKTQNYQLMRLDITNFDEPVNASITIGKNNMNKMLGFGFNQLYLEVPVISEQKNENVSIKVRKQLIADKTFTLYPVKPKTIYLMHHSHVDIGYTHVQQEVEELQWSFLESAIDLAQKSKDFPDGARFKWNVEVMWAVDSYLKKATPDQKKAFIDAVKNGWIELAGLYANELTALCNSRELIELTESARRIGHECGIVAESAMISDIPGWTWGIVPVLAKSGVRYLSLGTNQGHRIGDIVEKWGDKPFYWVSQSGQEEILCWIHQLGYSEFHTGLGYQNLEKVLKEDKVFKYLNLASESGYPYDILLLRYNIGSDNGPTDHTLSNSVKEWNEKYISPRLVISTVSEAFRAFEEKYAKQIPAVSGDLTGYWEDGAISSAKESSTNRRSANRMIQAETLCGLIDPKVYDVKEYTDTWQKILLFHEHTWGSWNSISEPEAEFTKQQWAVKQQFATDADFISKKLLKKIEDKRSTSNSHNFIEVFNTLSWKRSGPVFLSPDDEANSVIDLDGNKYHVQILSDGRKVFVATDVPAFSSKIYKFSRDILPNEGKADYIDNKIGFGGMDLELDHNTGAIIRLVANGRNYVDNSSLKGLNQYFYVKGRNPENLYGIENVKISLKENGPVIASFLVESDAPGCHSLSREIQLIKPLGLIAIINTIDKERIYDQEGLHFAFPFNVPDGQIRYNLAFSQVRVDVDQLQGSCKNYITMENFVDVSNQEYGITMAAPDAPIFEVGGITTDAIASGWIQKLEPSQTIFSYIMNNYWETNYCAYQEGITSFTYVLKPHGRFNSLEAEKFGMEQSQALIAMKGSENQFNPTFELSDNGLIVKGLKPVDNGILVHLYNPSGKPEQVKWNKVPKAIYLSNYDGEKLKPFDQEYVVPAFGTIELLLADKVD